MRYKIDESKSEISWTAFQPNNSISGKVYFKTGLINVQRDNAASGEVIVDFASIEVTDDKLNTEQKDALKNHLKSVDFFHISYYPDATFFIDSMKEIPEEESKICKSDSLVDPTHIVNGKIQFKWQPYDMNFPVKISFTATQLNAVSCFSINRLDWNLNFMKEESFKEKRILPENRNKFYNCCRCN